MATCSELSTSKWYELLAFCFRHCFVLKSISHVSFSIKHLSEHFPCILVCRYCIQLEDFHRIVQVLSDDSASLPSALKQMVAFIKSSIEAQLEQDKNWQRYLLVAASTDVLAQTKAENIEKRWQTFRATLERICKETLELGTDKWAPETAPMLHLQHGALNSQSGMTSSNASGVIHIVSYVISADFLFHSESPPFHFSLRNSSWLCAGYRAPYSRPQSNQFAKL